MYWVQDLFTSTRLVSAKFWAELNNNAKPILEKVATQIRAGSFINLPQSAGDCKSFDWNYVDGFF